MKINRVSLVQILHHCHFRPGKFLSCDMETRERKHVSSNPLRISYQKDLTGISRCIYVTSIWRGSSICHVFRPRKTSRFRAWDSIARFVYLHLGIYCDLDSRGGISSESDVRWNGYKQTFNLR